MASFACRTASAHTQTTAAVSEHSVHDQPATTPDADTHQTGRVNLENEHVKRFAAVRSLNRPGGRDGDELGRLQGPGAPGHRRGDGVRVDGLPSELDGDAEESRGRLGRGTQGGVDTTGRQRPARTRAVGVAHTTGSLSGRWGHINKCSFMSFKALSHNQCSLHASSPYSVAKMWALFSASRTAAAKCSGR